MISRHTIAITLGALAGCAAKVEPGPEPAPTAAPTTEPTAAPTGTNEGSTAAAAQVDENIGRLHALAVFEVGALIVDAPEGAYSCYGVCPQFKDEVAAAEAKSAARLDRLVAAATSAKPDPSPAACERAAIDRNLAALRDLKIVQVLALVEEKPKSSPQCYNNPCAEDIAAAQAKTCERAGRLAGIAAAAKGI
jgi:hypothetical protein